MRDLHTIDDELSYLARLYAAVRERGGLPSLIAIDFLLDERLALRTVSALVTQ